MLNVRVCPSCLTKRSNGYSRVSQAIWNACLLYVEKHNLGVAEDQDGFIEVRAAKPGDPLLMCNEDGFTVEDSLLQAAIQAGFSSYRLGSQPGHSG